MAGGNRLVAGGWFWDKIQDTPKSRLILACPPKIPHPSIDYNSPNQSIRAE
jgi:hypothetical protein